jgi:uncharacterized protein (TIGR03083 family)
VAQDGAMDRATHLASIRRDGASLLSAARGHLTLDVPTCPGWSLERLVGHVGRVYRWTAAWVATGSGERQLEQPPAGEAVLGWTHDALELLVDVLGAADPDAVVATWSGEQPAAFWPRRMAIETAVHRWDAQHAAGDPAPVDAALAVDAIDEMLAVIAPWRGTAELGHTGQTLHIHATDTPGEWFIRLAAEGLEVERTHAKGDVAVRGPASDLLLVLYNRLGTDTVDVFGDAGLLERWRTVVRV